MKKSIKNLFSNLFILLFSFLLIITVLSSGCKVNTGEPVVPEEALKENTAPEEEMEPASSLGELSPFTGLPIVTELYSRPFAVIVENLPQARPQSGLSKADIVYEVPVEGYISRFLALFSSPFEEDIGPVRSARPYFAYITKEYDGILAHCGYSIHTEAVLKNIKAKHIDERFNSLYYKRVKSRNMPHNLYTTLARLTLGAEKFDYLQGIKPIEPIFNFGERQTPELAVSTINIIFSPHNYVEYRWEPESLSYIRYNDSKLFVDANSGEGVKVKNIIIQFVNARVFTDEGHLEITLTGEGKGLLFSGGSVEEIKWRKNNYEDRTKFVNSNGSDIILLPGNTWIHLVPLNGKVEWLLS